MLSTIFRVNKFHFSITYKKDVILENKVLIVKFKVLIGEV